MKILFLVGFIVTTVQVSTVFAANKTPISVTAFEDRSARGETGGDCRGTWWFVSDDLGSAFKDLLVEKLQKTGRFQILEREHINRIYQNEFALVNSQKTKKNRAGHFKVARYTLAGAVTEFEWCQQSTGGGLDIGGLLGLPGAGISVKTSKSSVKVNVRLIDVETGEILYTASGLGEKKSTGIGINVLTKDVGFGGDSFKQSPLGEAVKDAIDHAADAVIPQIPKT